MPESSFGSPGLVAELVTECLDGYLDAAQRFGLLGHLAEENEVVTALDAIHVIERLLVGQDGSVGIDEAVIEAEDMVEEGGISGGGVQFEEGTCHERRCVFPFGFGSSVAGP